MLHTTAATMIPPLLVPAAIACSAVVLLVASLNDIASRTLPNWASLALVMIGIALRTADATLPGSLAAAALVFLLMLACWHRGWLGGGDVKLLAACTLLVPPGQVFHLVLATALAGGVLACLYLLLGRLHLLLGRLRRGHLPTAGLMRPHSLIARVWRVECWRIRRQSSLPYGCAIAAAALFMLIAPAGSFGT